jgi:hypothetical protein
MEYRISKATIVYYGQVIPKNKSIKKEHILIDKGRKKKYHEMKKLV